MLYQLVQAGQLLAVPMGDDDRDMAFMPAHDLATLTLRGVLEAVERSGQGGFEPAPTPEFLRVDCELERLRQAGLAQENVRIVELLGNEELKMKN